MKTTFFKHFLFIILPLCCQILSYGQSSSIPSKDSITIVQKQSLKYVKIEIGMNILDCPVLPVQLKGKLMMLSGIENYIVDQKSQSIFFNIPEANVTKEEIIEIAKKCGFPPQSVTVIMENKPFGIKQTLH